MKKKLKLKEYKLESFVTKLNDQKKETIVGAEATWIVWTICLGEARSCHECDIVKSQSIVISVPQSVVISVPVKPVR